jgi:hypothetical protein
VKPWLSREIAMTISCSSVKYNLLSVAVVWPFIDSFVIILSTGNSYTSYFTVVKLKFDDCMLSVMT